MSDTNILIQQATEGINNLNHISEKYRSAAIKNLTFWLENKNEFSHFHPQIEYWIEGEKWDLLLDAFYQIIPFGTGGRRGLVGVGLNRINIWTIRNSAQGHAQYLIKKHPNAKERGIAITYGVREFYDDSHYDSKRVNPVMGLTAKTLAHAASEVYAANGIPVYLTATPKTTPELSFMIRYLNAVGGTMIDASHNPPTDCGKKVFDSKGGQLTPPFDQELTDEVTKYVSDVLSIPFEEAIDKRLITITDDKISFAYHESVGNLSLSDARDIDIVYTPLHGPGSTSVLPVLKKAGFNVKVCPHTIKMSGRFENVKFNIPNPEVKESFEKTLQYAANKNAELILSTDPDADRVGAMVRHNGSWNFLNGNEIAALLTDYVISKKGASGGVIVKTLVTTSLLEKIAAYHSIDIIHDLLVGFKYIAEVMNSLESNEKIDAFLIGAEESHGYLAGNYSRDKDAAIAALWISELAAELKEKNSTLIDHLNSIYSRYGYHLNYLTEIRMLGAEGKDNIDMLQEELRNNPPNNFGVYKVVSYKDYWEGENFKSPTDKISRNVLVYHLTSPEGQNIQVTVRPSGTEPKTKFYFELAYPPCKTDDLVNIKQQAQEEKMKVEKAFLDYCYTLLGVDFPERGYLIFWQVPLKDKMKFFEIEQKLAKLIEVKEKKKRIIRVNEILSFLGQDAIDKVSDAFQAKYKKSIIEYLSLN